MIFNSVLSNSHHVLYQLLHPIKDIGYTCGNDLTPFLFLQKTIIWLERISCMGYLLCYTCFIFLLQDCKIVSYVLLILHYMSYYRGNSIYACWCHGLRLSDLNKENQRSVTHDYLCYINILTYLYDTLLHAAYRDDVTYIIDLKRSYRPSLN